MVRIEAAAISSGTSASHDPKTRARTIRAPSAPKRVSASRPIPPPPPESSPRASTPVTCRGAPPTDNLAAAARAAVNAASFSSGAGRPIGGKTSPQATFPSAETNFAGGPPAPGASAREPGTAFATWSVARRSSEPDAESEPPRGVATRTIGGITPPLP